MLRNKFLLRNLLYNRNIYRNFLSNEYNSVLNIRPQQEHWIKPNLAKSLGCVDMDIFVNKLTLKEEDQKAEICEQLLRIRSSEEATNLLDSTSFAVIRYFIDTNAVDQLVTILSNRLEYGIFINTYTGCYLMNYLLLKKKYLLAALIAVEHTLQDDLDNKLVQSLSLKSCYEYVKQSASQVDQEESEATPESELKKVRVKFIRNVDKTSTKKDPLTLVGKTLREISKKTKGELFLNMHFIGSIATGQYEEAANIVKSNSPDKFYKDILSLSLDYLSKLDDSENIKNDILNCQKNAKSDSYEEQLNNFVQDSVKQYQDIIIKEQEQIFNDWNELRKMRRQQELQQKEMLEREENAKKIMNDIAKEKELLWYFNKEDQIDLKIFSKKVTYPKRWFGKRKKPKIVDDSYVPPEIRRN